MDSTPKELECYAEAENLRQKRRDTENWQMGMYNMSAVSVAVSRALSGRKSRAKYMEEPISEKLEKTKQQEEENLTEEEIVEERKKLLAKLMTMQTNFELNHS